MKHLFPIILLAYLIGLLVVLFLAVDSRIDPGPVVRLGAKPDLQLEAPDFRAIESIAERKQVFFDFFRPLVAYENAYFQQERDRLLPILAKYEAGQRLSRGDKRKLVYWSKKFRLPDDMPLAERLEYLQRRIHVIPEAMVLAQAAAESAWGQSRFARQANNYFGQWCYQVGCGLVPLERTAGARHEVRYFESPLAAVRAYFINISTHRAYRPLRDKRLELEQEGEAISGHVLVGELGRYSERGQPYIRELRTIIRGNELE